jgi:hypothetical protein
MVNQGQALRHDLARRTERLNRASGEIIVCNKVSDICHRSRISCGLAHMGSLFTSSILCSKHLQAIEEDLGHIYIYHHMATTYARGYICSQPWPKSQQLTS